LFFELAWVRNIDLQQFAERPLTLPGSSFRLQRRLLKLWHLATTVFERSLKWLANKFFG
jgi:hypothetical protein